MRIVFVGGNKVSRIVVKHFVETGNEVVIIESNQDRINELSEILDCGFIHGDGTKPDVLKEVDPKKTDVLVCGTNDDHANIIASLLAKTLEFPRVITMISDVDLEPICQNLNLESTIFSAKTIGDYLQELVRGRDVFEMTKAVRLNLRFFTFKAEKNQSKLVKDFQLPDKTQIVWLFRGEEYLLTNCDTKIEPEDLVVIVTGQEHIEELEKQFSNS